jgi:multidrug efflux pump subunit AcrA (membrane-fusion protein)
MARMWRDTMKRRLPFAAAGALPIMASVGLYFHYAPDSGRKVVDEKVQPATLAVGQERVVDDEHVFVAVALPEQAIELIAQASGVVADVAAVGSHVVAGATIVRLQAEDVSRDGAEAEAEARQADAEVMRATAELRDAEQRSKKRQIDGVVSADERQSAEIAVEVQRANLEVAKQRAAQSAARYEKAKFRVEQLFVRAPFDGVVAARYQQRGTVVSPGVHLARFIGVRLPLVRFAVPYAKAEALNVGDHCLFFEEGATEKHSQVADIIRIAPEADPHSGLVVVEATFGEVGRGPLPGTVGKVDLAVQRAD